MSPGDHPVTFTVEPAPADKGIQGQQGCHTQGSLSAAFLPSIQLHAGAGGRPVPGPTFQAGCLFEQSLQDRFDSPLYLDVAED